MKRLIKPNTTKQVYFWNMSGSMCNAANTLLMTILCSWIVGADKTGIFSFAYAQAQQICIIGSFELRNIFITDTKKQFRFEDILGFEVISNSLMMLYSIGFIFVSKLTLIEALAVIVLTLFMVFMNLTDAFGGLFQKNEHLELTGRSLALDISLCTIIFGITLFITKNIVFASASMLITIALWVTFYDLPYAKSLSTCKPSFNKKTLFALLMATLPLALTTFLTMAFNNAPRNAIRSFLGNTPQAIYGYIYMPAFVINLFSLFLYRPMITTLASHYANRDFKSFYKIIRKELLYIVAFSLFCMVAGYLIGCQVLGFVYHTDLMPYRWLLVLSLLGGMFNALNTFVYYLLVIMRYQNMLLISYVAATVLISFAAGPLVKNFGLAGAFSGYSFGMMVVFAILSISLFVLLSKAKAKSQIPPQN